MCKTIHDAYNWLCDECFCRLFKERPEEFALCRECESRDRHFCHCCLTLFDYEIPDSICAACKKGVRA